jgi:hypothetical protein
MDEEDFQRVRKKVRDSYRQSIKAKLANRIVLIENNTIFPNKTSKITLVVKNIENMFLKDILSEEYQLYLKSIRSLDMAVIKRLSLKHKIDLAKLHGYTKYICDTDDTYLASVIEKTSKLYLVK